MNILGIHLTLLIGPPLVALPATPDLLSALSNVEVTLDDTGRSGFQINFSVGRSGPEDIVDYKLALNPLLKIMNRVVIMVKFNVVPEVLVDGFITKIESSPGTEPGSSTISITGEDLAGLFDMKELSREHPAMDETVIANRIILEYSHYGIIPKVFPPVFIDPPIPVERIPVQQGTDYQYLVEIAKRHGYVFFMESGPVPNISTAYWGPPPRIGIPQKALSANMGPETNIDQINFSNNSQVATRVIGEVQDRATNRVMPVQSAVSTRLPLSSQPSLLTQQQVRERQMRESGLTTSQAYGRAQGETDASTDSVVTATGELDALRYDCLLKPRRLVDVRGVGYTNDGTYYVKKVTHRIQQGQYKQSFELSRDGVGALLPVVSNPICI